MVPSSSAASGGSLSSESHLTHCLGVTECHLLIASTSPACGSLASPSHSSHLLTSLIAPLLSVLSADNSLNEMQWVGCGLVFAGIIGEQIASLSGGKKKAH